jgi:hypothetical protein
MITKNSRQVAGTVPIQRSHLCMGIHLIRSHRFDCLDCRREPLGQTRPFIAAVRRLGRQTLRCDSIGLWEGNVVAEPGSQDGSCGLRLQGGRQRPHICPFMAHEWGACQLINQKNGRRICLLFSIRLPDHLLCLLPDVEQALFQPGLALPGDDAGIHMKGAVDQDPALVDDHMVEVLLDRRPGFV